MDKHDCRKEAQLAVTRMEKARAKVRERMDSLPMTVKLAAGAELKEMHELLESIADLLLVLNEESKL